MMNMLINIFILGLICGAVTFTTSTTSIFSWPREILSKIHPKVEELVFCPWCSGFWLSLLLVSFTDLELPRIFEIFVINLLCNAFACLAVAGLLHYVLLLAYKPVAEAMMMRHKEKLQAKRNSSN